VKAGDTSVPDNDIFAMKYRAGSEVFRTAVRRHLDDAAASVPKIEDTKNKK